SMKSNQISFSLLFFLAERCSANSHCDPGYLLYGDFCYHFETESVKNWHDAEAHCSSEQGHLASFHSQEDLSFLTGEKACDNRPYSTTDVWTGLNDLFVPGYTWSDGTPLSHTNWGPGEPNNHEGREECVEMVSSTNGTYSSWNDLNCDAHQDWICMIAKGKDPIVSTVSVIKCRTQFPYNLGVTFTLV
uniref:Macrophage mannose receptor 1-like n=1 Tax=Seriola lalandi dorsalis TaxID=1841481 RepID=A0A3B4X068_SERLL